MKILYADTLSSFNILDYASLLSTEFPADTCHPIRSAGSEISLCGNSYMPELFGVVTAYVGQAVWGIFCIR